MILFVGGQWLGFLIEVFSQGSLMGIISWWVTGRGPW